MSQETDILSGVGLTSVKTKSTAVVGGKIQNVFHFCDGSNAATSWNEKKLPMDSNVPHAVIFFRKRIHQSINQSRDTNNQSVNQSIDRGTRTISQSINQSIEGLEQSVDQSINQSINSSYFVLSWPKCIPQKVNKAFHDVAWSFSETLRTFNLFWLSECLRTWPFLREYVVKSSISANGSEARDVVVVSHQIGSPIAQNTTT